MLIIIIIIIILQGTYFYTYCRADIAHIAGPIFLHILHTLQGTYCRAHIAGMENNAHGLDKT
jgi:hypothetical protein